MRRQENALLRKILLSYALTFMIIRLADSLTMIADGLVISRGLGSVALAATGLADPSYKIVTLFSGTLAVGLSTLCAHAVGSGDRERANRIFSVGLILCAASSLLVTAAGFVFTDPLCHVFGAKEGTELFQSLHDYLRGWFTGIPGYIFFFALSPLVALDGNKKCVTLAAFVQSAVNILGDVLSVFVLRTETFGVGFTTGLSYNVSALILFVSFLRKRSVFRPFSAPPDFRELPKTTRLGLSKMTEQLCRIAAPLLVNRTVIAVGGSLAMSAMSVKSSILGFCLIIGNAIAESVRTMTQILYSEKDEKALKGTVKSAFEVLFSFGFVFSLALFLLAGPVSGLYFPTGSDEWSFAGAAVRCLALSLLFNGGNLILIQYLQGAGKMVHVHLYTAFQRLLSLVFFTALLGKLFGPVGLFAAIPVSEATVLCGYVLIALSQKRKAGFANALLKIPDRFGYNSENSCSFSISTVEEAVEVSEKIEAFCNAHRVEKRKGYFSARCMEELTTNIITHGFTKDDKKHHCEIRVMLDPEEVVLRLRDDCPYFNIRERFDTLSADDYDSGVGIRLVYALAKDVRYIQIFNTNTLIIRM